MKKLGCGPILAILIVVVILLLIGSNQAAGWYFTNCQEEDFFDCLADGSEEPEPEEGSVTATGVYSYKDYSVTVTMNIPLQGGNVTGTMTGTCDGKVKGSFTGQDNGAITGAITGACSPFFVNIPARADFSGTVNKKSKTVPVSFQGKGAGITHNGSMSLGY